MSLFKIPFVFLAAYAYDDACRPPNPPAAEHEIQRSMTLDKTSFIWWRSYGTIIWQYATSLVEILTILAINFPSFSGSQTAISLLVFEGGSPQDIHLSLLSVLGILSIVIGAVIRHAAYRAMGRFFRYQLSLQDKHELIVTGPYSVVRHPGYTGLVFMVLGWFLWHGAEGSWTRNSGILKTWPGLIFMTVYSTLGIFGILVVTLGRIPFEEEALRKRFGPEWEQWARRVPYRLFPGIY